MLIVLGDGLHEIEPVAAFPALEFIGGHGDDSSVATAEIGHGFSIVHACPVPKTNFRPPSAIDINRCTAFSIGNGRSKQLYHPTLHHKPLPLEFSCLKMNALEHHCNRIETDQVYSANRGR